MSNDISRRRMVALTGTAVATGFVGCLRSGGESNNAESPEDDQESTEEQDNSANTDEPADNEEEPADWDYVDEVDGQVELVYGETAALSNGVEVIAHGVETFDEFSGEQPEERDEFALLHLESVHVTDYDGRSLLKIFFKHNDKFDEDGDTA